MRAHDTTTELLRDLLGRNRLSRPRYSLDLCIRSPRRVGGEALREFLIFKGVPETVWLNRKALKPTKP